MKCNVCGALGFTASACPECGSSNIVEETGGATQTPTPELPPGPPVMPQMPEMVVADVKGPVVGTIKLPGGGMVELRDGEEFLAANEDTDADVHLKVADSTASKTPVKIFARNGKLFATGGGGNGFALAVTTRYKPAEEIEIPRSTTVSVVVGKDTKLPVK